MKRNSSKRELPPLRYEPGWHGAFTRTQADGAIPNGTAIVKVGSDESDANQNGTKGRVLGSMRHPDVMDNLVLYFLEWETAPRVAVACPAWKIAAPDARAPIGSSEWTAAMYLRGNVVQ